MRSQITWTDLGRANLVEVDFSKSYLRRVILYEADVRQSKFSKTNLVGVCIKEADWLEKLDEWQVRGAQEVRDEYEVVEDVTGRTVYQLDLK